MDQQTWREKIVAKIRASATELRAMTPRLTYGYLASCALLPLVTAAQTGNPWEAVIALSGILSSTGIGLISSHIHDWHKRSEAELAGDLANLASSDPAWQEVLNSVIESHQLLNEVKAILDEQRWEALQQTLTTEFNLHIQIEYAEITAGDHTVMNIETAVIQAQPEVGQSEAQDLWRTYLQRIVHDTSQLDLSGVDHTMVSGQDEKQLDLAAIYTALNTLQSDPTESRGADFGQRGSESAQMERRSALAFVNQEQYAALLGDPGSGKTTFTKFLALCLAGERLGLTSANIARLGEEWQHGDRLPIRVVLRHFATTLSHDQHDLWDYICTEMGHGLQPLIPLLNRHLIQEGGLLILDGLDEVPEAAQQRDQVQQAVKDFRRDYPKVQIVITSRTYAYQRQGWKLPGFADTVLAPFDPEQIDSFVDSWYAHIAQVRPSLSENDAQARAVRLKHAIQESDHLRELAPRPLLLTLMASLHAWRGGTLPQAREQLYEESVELLLDIWQRPKLLLDPQGNLLKQDANVEEWFKIPLERFRRALERLAYAVHSQQPKTTGTADIGEADLVQALREAVHDPDLRPDRVVAYIQDRAGLLTNRGEAIYSFPHRTFQEYLAARYFTEHGFPGQLVQAFQDDPERWREVALLAGAKVARGTPFAGWSLASKLCPMPYEATESPLADPSHWWSTLLAGQILVETEIYRHPDAEEQVTLARIKKWLTALIHNGHLPPIDRAQAGMVLGTLGDERPGVGLLKNGLPDIDWITIEPGPFIMGSDETDARNNQMQQFTCDLIHRPYAISRYPVTVAQYHAFVAAGGYEEQSFWTEAGWAWREKYNRTKPDTFSNPAFLTPNHPQVGVTWYEALAFCNWLSAETECQITLPNEVEWERAARHTDGRRYPWGDEFIADHCNGEETGIGYTSAVGLFPKGHALCGAADMAGNVWEWTRSLWTKNWRESDEYGYPYRLDDGREDLTVGDEGRVTVRGGSYYYDEGIARCAFRLRRAPYRWNHYDGFRCCCRRPH